MHQAIPLNVPDHAPCVSFDSLLRIIRTSGPSLPLERLFTSLQRRTCACSPPLLRSALLLARMLTCRHVAEVSTPLTWQMAWPYPFKSPLDPSTSWDQKDYSMTNPLQASGTDYPCKGYINSALPIKAVLTAGAPYALKRLLH